MLAARPAWYVSRSTSRSARGENFSREGSPAVLLAPGKTFLPRGEGVQGIHAGACLMRMHAQASATSVPVAASQCRAFFAHFRERLAAMAGMA